MDEKQKKVMDALKNLCDSLEVQTAATLALEDLTKALQATKVSNVYAVGILIETAILTIKTVKDGAPDQTCKDFVDSRIIESLFPANGPVN